MSFTGQPLFKLFIYFWGTKITMSKIFNYGIDRLTVGKTIAIASGGIKAVLSEKAIQKIHAINDTILAAKFINYI